MLIFFIKSNKTHKKTREKIVLTSLQIATDVCKMFMWLV